MVRGDPATSGWRRSSPATGNRACWLSRAQWGWTVDQRSYPIQFSVDYPDRTLDRVSTLFRIFAAIPILIVLAAVSGGSWQWSSEERETAAAGAGGLLFFGP